MKLVNVKMAGIDMSDYPDFCDAYIEYAEYENGHVLTDEELDAVNGDSQLVYELVETAIY